MTILAEASFVTGLIACGAKDGSSSSSGNTSGGLDCSKAFSCSLGSTGGSGCPAGQTCNLATGGTCQHQ